MKISYIVPQFHNIGDKVVWLGAKARYEKLYPGAEHELLFLCDQPHDLIRTDLLAVVGTPWVWDLCGVSEKYRVLRCYLDLARCGRKEAIGIGANYPLAWADRRYLKFQHADQCRRIREMWRRFDHVVVRDPLAKEVLDICGAPCVLEDCPSHLTAASLGVQPGPQGENTMIFYDLLTGIGSETMTPDHGAAWHRLIFDAIEKYEIKKVICIFPHEAEAAAKLGIEAEVYQDHNPTTQDPTPVIRVLERLASCGTIVSGRVHLAIPAHTLGRRVVILPVDSRHTTAPCPTFYDEHPTVARWYE